MKRTILASILAAFVGTSTGGTAALGQITNDDGFVDVELPISSFKLDKEGAIHLSAAGIVEGRRVGFGLDIDSNWKMQKLDNVPITIYRGSATVRSTVAESDAFLSLLAEKYGNGQTRMRNF